MVIIGETEKAAEIAERAKPLQRTDGWQRQSRCQAKCTGFCGCIFSLGHISFPLICCSAPVFVRKYVQRLKMRKFTFCIFKCAKPARKQSDLYVVLCAFLNSE